MSSKTDFDRQIADCGSKHRGAKVVDFTIVFGNVFSEVDSGNAVCVVLKEVVVTVVVNVNVIVVVVVVAAIVVIVVVVNVVCKVVLLVVV